MKLTTAIVNRQPTPHTRRITHRHPPRPRITILNPTLRIIRIDLTELDLGKYNPRKTGKQLIDILARECGHFNGDGDVGPIRPFDSLEVADLSTVRVRCCRQSCTGCEVCACHGA